MLPKRTLEKIKKALPNGAKKAIATRTGLQEETIRKILGGHRFNQAVIICALNLATLSKDDKQKISHRLHSEQ